MHRTVFILREVEEMSVDVDLDGAWHPTGDRMPTASSAPGRCCARFSPRDVDVVLGKVFGFAGTALRQDRRRSHRAAPSKQLTWRLPS